MIAFMPDVKPSKSIRHDYDAFSQYQISHSSTLSFKKK